jgi:hypothetical protein
MSILVPHETLTASVAIAMVKTGHAVVSNFLLVIPQEVTPILPKFQRQEHP